MESAAVKQYILDTFAGVEEAKAYADSFFIYDPEQKLADNKRLPFTTVVENDNYDTISKLSRPGVYRLNIGVSKETYVSLFGEPPQKPGAKGIVNTGHDFAALNQLMPHPIYALQSWVCVLNPDGEVWEQAKPLLAEAYDTVVKKYAKARRKKE